MNDKEFYIEYVYGIGCDVLSISRLENLDEHTLQAMSKKILNENELPEFEASSNKAKFLAVRFSVKESIAKSVKTGFRGFGMKDIQIIKTPLGAPEVLYFGKLKDIIEEKGIVRIEVSISHDGDFVFTNAIALRK